MPEASTVLHGKGFESRIEYTNLRLSSLFYGSLALLLLLDLSVTRTRWRCSTETERGPASRRNH
jgi:hypothetical protein